jgi:carbamoyltransferase
MKALALHLGHNATAAIMANGAILGVLSQEKVDGIKNSDAFPIDAARALCDASHWSLDDIEQVVLSSRLVYRPGAFVTRTDKKRRYYSTNPAVAAARWLERAAGHWFPAPFEAARAQLRRRQQAAGDQYLAESLRSAGLDRKPLIRFDHHHCHARAAYHSYSQPGDGATLVFTLDGEGDDISATVSRVEADGTWNTLSQTPAHDSLGWIYSGTTRFLGMRILEHEYKVMGLAPYAKQYYIDAYERIFAPAIRLADDASLRFRAPFHTAHFYDYLVDNAVGERFDNIAAAVQHLLEERVTQWVQRAIAQTGVRRIAVGGGVFMNVKLNKKLQELPEVERIVFMPSGGDESLPIGALYALAAQRAMQTRPLHDLYLGPAYSDPELERFIASEGLAIRYQVERIDGIEAHLAELLAEGEIVARFSGRSEWGARSLGNRAILAHPSRMESFYTVNDQIKSRDFWMPFAPTILDSFAGRYLTGYNPAKTDGSYMITAFDVRPDAVAALRAALHQGDMTVRPQVLRRDANPDYYALIKHFSALTGVGAVLNTSLNLHGQPLVASPTQALYTFENSGLRNLALGPFLVRKA